MKRLIIVHIGSDDVFLKKGLLTFQSNKTEYYLDDTNVDVLEEYFEEMLKCLPAGSVVVMDNGSYHSRCVEKTPTSPWRKQEIVEWLTSKDIPCQANIIKKELQSIVNLYNHLLSNSTSGGDKTSGGDQVD